MLAELDERLERAGGKVCLYLFLAALGIRFLYLSQYAQSPLFWVPALDSLYHDLLARAILAGKESPEPFFRAPLYYYFLAGVFKVFGHSFWAARLIQALVGSGSCLLLYHLGRRLFGPAVAVLAAAAMALYGPLVFFDGELLTPVLEVFLDLWFLLLVLRASENREWLGAGLVLGLSAITRPNILVTTPLVLWLLWSERIAGGEVRSAKCEERPSTNLKSAIGNLKHSCHKFKLAVFNRQFSIVAFLAGVALFPGLVTARNLAVSGDPVFIASQGGVNLFLGNRPGADGFTPSTPTRYAFQGEYDDSVKLYGQRAAEEALGRKLTASEAQRYWASRVREWWREDPGAALRLTWKKFVLAWTHREIRNNHAFDFVRKEFAPYLWLAPFGFWYAGPLGLLGMLLAWREGPRARFLAAFVLVYVLSFVAFFVADRYRLPVVPVLLLFAAYAVVRLTGWAGGRDRRRLAPAAAGLLALALFVGVDWYAAATPQTWALDAWSTGNRYKDLSKLPEAERWYRRALAVQPDNADIWTNLGVVQFGQSRPAEAAESFRKALALQPDNAGNWQNLAVCELQLGRNGAALQHLREALRLDPGNAAARRQLRQLGAGQP